MRAAFGWVIKRAPSVSRRAKCMDETVNGCDVNCTSPKAKLTVHPLGLVRPLHMLSSALWFAEMMKFGSNQLPDPCHQTLDHGLPCRLVLLRHAAREVPITVDQHALEAEPRAVQERQPVRGVGRRERPEGASTHGGPAREGQRAVARAALQHSYGAVRGDCECGHDRACGSAEDPGLKQGSFLIRSVSEMIRLGPWHKGLLERGAHRAGGGKIRLGPWEKAFLKERRSNSLRRGAHWSGVGKIRFGPWEKDYSQERRSLVYKWKDPSRTWEKDYSQERRSLVWRWKDPSRTRRGAALTGLEVERSVSDRRKKNSLRRGAHWSGGGKIRLGPWEREFPKERRSLVWRWKHKQEDLYRIPQNLISDILMSM